MLLWLRRAHLYFGLMLFPWAVLYGITGYLFNHPTHFADMPMQRFDRSLLRGTPMEQWPTATQLAEEVVAKLNARDGTERYRLASKVAPKFANEFLFGRQDRETTTLSFLVHVSGSGGTIRTQPKPAPSVTSPSAPFAVPAAPASQALVPAASSTPPSSATSNLTTTSATATSDTLRLDQDLAKMVVDSIQQVLPKLGEKDSTPVLVTSIPDLVFTVSDKDQVWEARYNILRGTVSGQLASTAPTKQLTVREYLLRLHTAHGFPDEQNARWWWAIIVDLMSFVLIGWTITGLIMWWKIKATRKWGFAAILFGSATAVIMGWAMLQTM
jgi:hypothetical protein